MDIKNRIEGEVYFITDTVVDWVDIFTRPIYRHIIIESLEYCQKEKWIDNLRMGINDKSHAYDSRKSW